MFLPRSLRRAASALFDAGAGWWLPPERFPDLDSLLGKVRAGHELRFYDDALDFIAQVRDAGRREALLKKAYPAGAKSATLRRLLREPRHRYQAEGALFAARAGRCLIGDDMGLGKTVQAIAAAEMLTKHLGVERVLVICPASLKHQWERELERFTGRKALVIGGGQAARRRLYGALDGGQTEVSLGGSRLARFMEGVEKATGGVARPQVEEPIAPEVPGDSGEPPDVPATSPEAADAAAIARERGDGGDRQAAETWHGLITAGLQLATQVLSAARQSASGGAPGSGHALLETDPGTGRRYLKLPVPDQGTLDKLVEVLAALTRR